MRNKSVTRSFYTGLGFEVLGGDAFDDYLMVQRDTVEIHFFLFKELDPAENYGQVYIRVNDIDKLYQSFTDGGQVIHPNGSLQNKPWRQREFAMLDPDHNLLTFGQGI